MTLVLDKFKFLLRNSTNKFSPIKFLKDSNKLVVTNEWVSTLIWNVQGSSNPYILKMRKLPPSCTQEPGLPHSPLSDLEGSEQQVDTHGQWPHITSSQLCSAWWLESVSTSGHTSGRENSLKHTNSQETTVKKSLAIISLLLQYGWNCLGL